MAGESENRTGAKRAEPGLPIRARLLLVIAVTLGPMLLVVCAALFEVSRVYTTRDRAQLELNAQGFARALDDKFTTTGQLLSVLARDMHLMNGDVEGFRRRWSGDPSLQDRIVVLYAADGRVEAIISAPGEDPPPRNAGEVSAIADEVRAAAAGSTAEVSNLIVRNVVHPGVAVKIPMSLSDGRRFVISQIHRLAEFEPLLRESNIPHDWYAALFDRNMQHVASTSRQVEFMGKPAGVEFEDAIRAQPDGLIDGAVSVDGEQVVAAVATAPVSRYRVILGVPQRQFTFARNVTLAALGLGMLLSFSGAAFAMFASRTISEAIRSLSRLSLDRRRMEASKTGVPEVDAVSRSLIAGRRAEQAAMSALTASEKIARRTVREIEALYANAPVGIAIFDRQRRFLRVNDTLAAMNGYSREEHIGRDVYDLLPYLRPYLEPIFEGVFREGKVFPHVEIHRAPTTPEEREGWFIVRYFPVEEVDGEVVSVGAIVEDVSAQREAEAAVRKHDRRLQFVVANIPSLAWVADDQGRIVFRSQRWAEVTGVSDLSDENWEQVVHPDDRGPLREAWDVSLRTHQPLEREMRVLCADGVYRWHLCRARRQTPEPGDRWSWFGAAALIDEQKSVEDRLRRALTEREVLIREVDHRVKNSLAVVMSLLRLQMRLTGHEEVREHLQDAAQRISSIARLHDRLNRGASVTEVEGHVFLAELCEDLTGAFGLSGGGRSIDLKADPVMFTSQQAVSLGLGVTELVTNAVKYGSGDVSVTLKALADGSGELIVCDEGDGPPLETAKAQTSLGLQIVRAMATQVGGSFVVERRGEINCSVIRFSAPEPEARA